MTMGLIILGVMFALLVASVPVALAAALAGFIGIAVTGSLDQAIFVLGSAAHAHLASPDLAVLPIFVLMGFFVTYSGAVGRFFSIATRRFSRFPAVTGLSTLLAGGVFAGASGTSTADVVVLTQTALPELRRNGYTDRAASGLIANVAALAILIPPSFALVVYGLATDTRLDMLLLAGIGPGLVLMVAYGTLIIVTSRRKAVRSTAVTTPAAAPPVTPETVSDGQAGAVRPAGAVATVASGTAGDPPAGEVSAGEPRQSWVRDIRDALPLAVIVLSFPAGLYSGLFTVSETASAVATMALLYMIITNRRTWFRKLVQAFREAVATYVMIALIIVGTSVFSTFLTSVRLPHLLAEVAVGSGFNRYVTFAIIAAILFVLGMFMDALAMLLITLPITFSTVMALGFDPVWFGVICVMMVEIAVVTPPFGMNLFALKARAPDISWKDLCLGVWPYVAVNIGLTVLLVAVPQIALFIPSQLGG